MIAETLPRFYVPGCRTSVEPVPCPMCGQPIGYEAMVFAGKDGRGREVWRKVWCDVEHAYCSAKCKQKAYRRRKAAAAGAR